MALNSDMDFFSMIANATASDNRMEGMKDVRESGICVYRYFFSLLVYCCFTNTSLSILMASIDCLCARTIAESPTIPVTRDPVYDLPLVTDALFLPSTFTCAIFSFILSF